MLEIILELLGEFIVALLSLILSEWGLERRSAGGNRSPATSKILFYLGILFYGALFGVGITSVFTQRIFRIPVFTGVSLTVVPLIAGFTMKQFGDWRRNKGHQPTELATFWGGALFAFGVALVRWLKIGG